MTGLSYFKTLLEKYLYDHFPGLLEEKDFIQTRTDLAEDTYQEVIEQGKDVNTALEYAQRELFIGLEFSSFDTLMDIVQENFAEKIPEEQCRDFCIGLIPESEAIFQKFQAFSTNDFRTPSIQMEAELIGLIESRLNHGL